MQRLASILGLVFTALLGAFLILWTAIAHLRQQGDGIEAYFDPRRLTSLAYLGTDLTTRFGSRRVAVTAWIAALETAAPEQRDAALAAGINALERRVSAEPTDGFAWLVLASFRQNKDGYSDAVAGPLRMSYYTTRLEIHVMVPRAQLMLALWPILPEDLKREARWEMADLLNPGRQEPIKQLAHGAFVAGPDRVAMVAGLASEVHEWSRQFFDVYIAEEKKARRIK